ncbi:MAG TPA: site-specific integrase [Candidatus Methanomethylophilaceae archaeon]|nr:site-specific integrase [Candidatus Methanomethylophilaceae archaeon]
MARPKKVYKDDVAAFVDHITAEEDYANRTIRFYRDEGSCIFKLLDLHVRPNIRAKDVTKQEVYEVLRHMRANGYAVQTMKGYMTALRKITLYHGNPEPTSTKIRWPHDARPSVDWLTAEEAQILLDHPKNPMQDISVHLELCMGLRRIEVVRLRVSDIDYERRCVTVTGKSGKLRLVPFHPETEYTLSRYMEYRTALVTIARSENPEVNEPEELIIWGRSRQLSAYSQVKVTGFDKQLKALIPEVGFKFSNHTLRRTFGRAMYRSNVPVATIAKILGHESTDVTLTYIGVDLDDMSAAMSQFVLRSSDVSKLLEECVE